MGRTLAEYDTAVWTRSMCQEFNIGRRHYYLWVNEAMNEIELSLLNHKRNRRDGSHLGNIFVQDV
jgi:hypothetical protein